MIAEHEDVGAGRLQRLPHVDELLFGVAARRQPLHLLLESLPAFALGRQLVAQIAGIAVDGIGLAGGFGQWRGRRRDAHQLIDARRAGQLLRTRVAQLGGDRLLLGAESGDGVVVAAELR